MSNLVGKAASKLSKKILGTGKKVKKKSKKALGLKDPKPLNERQKKVKPMVKSQGVMQEATRLAKTEGTKTGLKVGSGIGFVAGMAAAKALSTLKTQDKQTTKNLSDFEKKFAKARKEGKPTFMFKGNEFNTKLKGKK